MKIFRKLTWENLKKNKTRTIVTIIGIILSAAMFTAVTGAISSVRHLLIERSLEETGSWYANGLGLDSDDIAAMDESEELNEYTAFQNIGFAELDHSHNQYKPYLFLEGIDDNAADMTAINVTEGRLPETTDEIMLPEHLSTNGGITYEIGDVISLAVGDRQFGDGSSVSNHVQYSEENQEQIAVTFEKEYTVTGFYERPFFEDYSAPGYTALTVADPSLTDVTYDVYVTLKSTKDIDGFALKYLWNKEGGQVNNSYLRWIGAGTDMSFNLVAISMGAILMAIIFAGSVSLIYNAFAISVSERMKQFGIMSSVGATRRQLMSCVLLEGCFLAVIGIPLGILSGLLGLAVTFHFVGDMFGSALLGTSIKLQLYPSIPGILIAALVAFLTIIISAVIPARKALRFTAIETIRQSDEIRLTSKQVKTGKLSRKLFGIEGMIAAKNYRRNRRKYRATVASIFLSVVLFISAGSFSAYLIKGGSSVYDDTEANIVVSVYRSPVWDSEEDSDDSSDSDTAAGVTAETGEFSYSAILQQIEGLSGVTNASVDISQVVYLQADKSDLTEKYVSIFEEDAEITAPSVLYVPALLRFISDDEFAAFAAQENITINSDAQMPQAILCNSARNYTDDKYVQYEVFKNPENTDLTMTVALPSVSEMSFSYISWKAGAFQATYNDGNDYEHAFSLDKVTTQSEIQTAGAAQGDAPLISKTKSMINIYYPVSQMAQVMALNPNLKKQLDLQVSVEGEGYCIATEDHEKTTQELNDYFDQVSNQTGGDVYGFVHDVESDREANQSMIFVINVFSWGFIVLISLISMANIFNTITTNIQLRRREIAMLISAGMSKKGLHRMMRYECILYGSRGLLYGLPVSIALTWLIYRAMGYGVEMTFFIPWYPVVIAVGSVFLILFVTMMYAVRKVEKENIIEALKEENI